MYLKKKGLPVATGENHHEFNISVEEIFANPTAGMEVLKKKKPTCYGKWVSKNLKL